MEYRIYFVQANRQLLDIEVVLHGPFNETELLKLPQWRPGRYELGNFAKNVRNWHVINESGDLLGFRKTAMDSWEIKPGAAKKIIIKYQYYAAELNAGSTWLDPQQLYVNPVNCLMYHPDRMHQACTLKVEVPVGYKMACGLAVAARKEDIVRWVYHFHAEDFHQLADSPFIASPTLQHNIFVLDGVEFNLWIQGEVHLDWSVILGDFFIFINEQMVMFKGFPHSDYHFLIQVLPYQAYHGVEHCNSTVITIGPGIQLNKKILYDELLGVSCHELFHVWNVKHIRPADMLPYDYSQPNYSRLGYVYEGLTTYYGDYLLYRSGVFSDEDYFKTFDEQIQKHFHNPGRKNYSVAESSFDTWLDGYTPGVPGRKVSIYTEGCLLAFMTDVLIRQATNDEKCLDDVMRTLWEDFGKKKIGYTERDYQSIIENVSGVNWNEFFKKYVNGCANYKWPLRACMEYLGLDLSLVPSAKPYEALLGFKVMDGNPECIVSAIYPNSIAEVMGLMLKDKIVAVNGMEVKNNLSDLCTFVFPAVFDLTVQRFGKEVKISLETVSRLFYRTYRVTKKPDATDLQKARYFSWCGRVF